MNNDLRPINTIPNFKRFCMTIGELPTSYLETMTYYEMLVWFTEYMKNTIIPTINNNGLAVEELQNKYIELKSYVDNYFTNLDVQQEINNKLDAMAESGELTDIIAQYLGLAGVLSFNTIADMKKATNLVNGSTCRTLGYYTINDNGGALYKIRNISNEDVVNNMDIIPVSNNLIAEYIINDNKINADQFGAKGDNTTDDKDVIQFAINYALNKNINVELSKKTYLISNSILINQSGTLKLIFNGNNGTLKGNFNDYLIKANVNTTQQFIIENLELNGSFKANGLSIYKSQRFSLKNVIFHYCLKGLTIINSWYGNVDSNCMFDSCLHAINLEEDLEDSYYGEVNTIEFGNLSIDSHNVTSSNFNIENEKSTGVKINTLVHSVKFNGTIVENCDIGIKGCETNRTGNGTIYGIVIFDKCYFEDCSYRLIDWTGSETKYIVTNFIFTNNNIYPLSILEAHINQSRFFIQNNMAFKIVPYLDNKNLELITDVNDYYIKTENYNYTTKVEKIQNRINRSSVMLPSNMAQPQTYPSSTNMNLAVQDDNYLMYQFFMNNNNVTIKNSKALSINSKNISFDSQDLIPKGIIINGNDGKKYMLSTNDGTSVTLIEMKNQSRVYERANSYSAYWLYAHKDSLPNGFIAWCNDLDKSVKLVKNGNTGEWWTNETNSYLCIGTSSTLFNNLSVQPNYYWKPCWDLSFNHGVFLHGNTKYNSGYDWSMNNNPQDTSAQILAYGTISQRPESPAYKSVYYATDENKYYTWDMTTWTEITKIM